MSHSERTEPQATDVILSRETFVRQLDLERVVDAVGSPAELERLYDITSEWLRQEGHATPVAAGDGGSEMNLKLPGLPIHVRLSAPTRDEIELFVTAGVMLLGAMRADPGTLGVGAVVALLTRVRLLRARYGELCLVEAIGELKRPTARNICASLLGKPCRRPKANCQFHQDGDPNGDPGGSETDSRRGTCGFALEPVQITIGALEERKIIRRLNAVDPAEYGVVF